MFTDILRKMVKFLVEHMEAELADWALTEYRHIVQWVLLAFNFIDIIVQVGPKNLILSHLDAQALESMPKDLLENAECLKESVEFMDIDKSKIILLDPSATEELKPSDADCCEYMLFGGILGDIPSKDRYIYHSSCIQFISIEPKSSEN